ncbi:MAG TPA: glycoside hydrolase family 3 N-terminal domain-containing protein, partial [Thermoanaerobaculia bacterium]|nr:glycoside hydrolase family 3 N-terminal domain-containing protein [Thermoanaerobaculia bacterium]
MRTIMAVSLFLAVASAARADRSEERWIERTLRSMPVEEKIGQLLIPNIGGGFHSIDGDEFRKLQRWVTELHVGGVHVASGQPPATALLINDLQRLAKVPLLVTADLEGGAGFIFPGATRLPLAMAIGAAGSEELAYAAGKVSALEGKALGIGVDFYPVVDVQNNPRNPIINIRSFGEDPQKVSALARAYIRGIQDAGMLATAKHFPGHGDVATDSHLEMPVLDVTRERLDAIELAPFRAAIEEGVAAIMTAHIHLPALEQQKGIPATLSRSVLTDLLRKNLRFEGLLFTDAMDMRAVSANFSEEESSVRAIEAGADVVLFPRNPEIAFNALRGAVESGRLSMSRLDEAVRRILRAKARAGLTCYRPADLDSLSRVLGSSANRDVARRINEAALTLVRDEQASVPLRLDGDKRVLHVNLLDSRNGWREGPVGRVAAAELPK